LIWKNPGKGRKLELSWKHDDSEPKNPCKEMGEFFEEKGFAGHEIRVADIRENLN